MKLNRQTVKRLIKHGLPTALALSITLNIWMGLLVARNSSTKQTAPQTASAKPDQKANELFDQINPKNGYELNVTYGTLGPKMLASGIINLDKFKSVYKKSGTPLTQEQLDILTKGSNTKIRITSDNSYFLLNFFWAVGLANRTKILTEGEITKYGKGEIGNFASTGGWSLASGPTMAYFADSNLIPLSPAQEKLVNDVASNIYRPCCNNSTAFPDCNHGMALLGILELMAAGGASQEDMYNASKYINAYWFPGNYYDLALYFREKEGKRFSDVAAKTILSKQYSSASGWQDAKSWLAGKGIIEQPKKQGGGCGV